MFNSAQGLSEVLFEAMNPASWIEVQAGIKVVLATVANVLSFTGNVLGAVRG